MQSIQSVESIRPTVQVAPPDLLTASGWATILGHVDSRAFRKRGFPPTSSGLVDGRLTPLYSLEALPPDYRADAGTAMERHSAPSYTALLSMLKVERRWESPRPWLDYPESARERARWWKATLAVYFAADEAGMPKSRCEYLASNESILHFRDAKTGKPKRISTRRIRAKVAIIEQRGGYENAPLVAYCDDKSTPHLAARNTHRLAIPEEFAAHFAGRCKTEHLSSAYRSIILDWQCDREIPGVGSRSDRGPTSAAFPWTLAQLRHLAPGTAARRMASHGIARAKREALPWHITDTSALRFGELLLLDDTRVDIVAARDRDGFPVTLKSYILMDVATRKILGYIVKEEEDLRAEDVWSLLSRVLSSVGIPEAYPMRIKFERGAVACSDATQTLLESLFPGRIIVGRTGMNGGRRNSSGWCEQASGNFMGKAHIESFMRTFAFGLEHIAGQRGGDYRRQPAGLGLIGKNRAVGRLDYTRGSQIHDGARTEMCDRILRWLETGELAGAGEQDRQLRLDTTHGRHLMPVRWVRDAILESVAAYNANTDHRMLGFAAIEYQDPETGALRSRRESPDERAAWLADRSVMSRISDADAAALMAWRGRAVSITPNGVTIDCSPWKALNFYSGDSRLIHEVSRLTGLARRYVALVDEDALSTWRPETSSWTPAIHIIGDVSADKWRPGQPGRYLETLPLRSWGGCTDPLDNERLLAEKRRVASRAQAELLYAARGVFPDEVARQTEHAERVGGAISIVADRAARTAPDSELVVAASEATRTAQRLTTEPLYAASLGDIQAAREDEY